LQSFNIKNSLIDFFIQLEHFLYLFVVLFVPNLYIPIHPAQKHNPADNCNANSGLTFADGITGAILERLGGQGFGPLDEQRLEFVGVIGAGGGSGGRSGSGQGRIRTEHIQIQRTAVSGL